jgi:hypothetical protein
VVRSVIFNDESSARDARWYRQNVAEVTSQETAGPWLQLAFEPHRHKPIGAAGAWS